MWSVIYLIAMLQAFLIWFSAFTVGLPLEGKISTDTLQPNILRAYPVFVPSVTKLLKASGVSRSTNVQLMEFCNLRKIFESVVRIYLL